MFRHFSCHPRGFIFEKQMLLWRWQLHVDVIETVVLDRCYSSYCIPGRFVVMLIFSAVRGCASVLRVS
jgi:hypothetical protein